jgi:hypothetical protein
MIKLFIVRFMWIRYVSESQNTNEEGVFISQAALDKLAEDTAVAVTSPEAAPSKVEGSYVLNMIYCNW